MSIKATARSRAGIIFTATTFALAIVVALITLISGAWQLLPVVLLIAVVGIAIQLLALHNRDMTHKLHTETAALQKAVTRHATTLQEIQRSADGIQRSADSHDQYLMRIDNRARKINPTINNIAGSVGRMAPIVRQLQAELPRVHSEPKQTINPKSQAVAPPAQPPAEASRKYTFPPVEPARAQPTHPGTYVAVIADEFTAEAFAHEWETINPTPDSWRTDFEARRPDFLFVESAWEANDKSWLYHFTGPTAPRPAVYSLIEYCKQNGIPTVFWNKEDPPHFEDFLDTAALFDYVYTTDGNLIPEYKSRLGHNRIGVLPFAAQPRVHNPGRVARVPRDREIVFGGMYFRHKYPERREQLSILLPAAAKLGLDIYSRQAGGDANYQFPDEYSKHVRGALPYPEMLTAYHAYKVVLNVNSVTNSPTMCARRIFEATASGAAVVTTSTEAIERFFPRGLLTTVTDSDDAYDKMRSLLRSDEYRDRLVHRAQRHVWETATYSHRASQVMGDLGISHTLEEKPASFVITSNRPEHLDIAFANVARQNIEDRELLFLSHGFEVSREDRIRLADTHGIERVTFMDAPESDSLGKNLNRLFAAADGEVLLRMDDDDYYGPNYATDLIHALGFSGSQLVGKAETYIYFEESNSTILTYIGHSHRHTPFVRGATFCGPKGTFAEFKFPESRTGEDSSFLSQVTEAGGTIYSADRFNFLVKRRASKKTHTWTVSDARLFGSGEMRFVGDDPSQVDV